MPLKQPEPRYLLVGRVLRPHGVRGELRVEMLTDYPERIATLDTVYVGASYQPYKPLGVRVHKGAMLLTLDGCADRDAAEALRGQPMHIDWEDAVPLEEGEYYHSQLVGLRVELEDGTPLGELVEVFEAPGANDVYVVHGPRGEVLLPAIEDVIRSIDFEAQRMVIHPLPGLLGD